MKDLTDIQSLAGNLGVAPTSLLEAKRRGLLSFVQHRGEPSWFYGDEGNGCFRRIDGKPFRISKSPVKAESKTRGEDWHRLIGLDEAIQAGRRWVVLILEGSKDALAAFSFAEAEDTLADVSIVTALGSGLRLRPDDLEKLRGKLVRIIGDIDEAGREAVENAAARLEGVAAEVQTLDLAGLRCSDDKPVKDLADVLCIHADDFESDRELWNITRLDSHGPRVRIIPPKGTMVSNDWLHSLKMRGEIADHESEIIKSRIQKPIENLTLKPLIDKGLQADPNIEDIEYTEYPDNTENSEGVGGNNKNAISPRKHRVSKGRGRPPLLATRLVNESLNAANQPKKQLFALARGLAAQRLRYGAEQPELERQCATKFAKKIKGKTEDLDLLVPEHVFTMLRSRIPKVRIPVGWIRHAVDLALKILSDEPPVIHPILNAMPCRERVARVCRILGRTGHFPLPVREAARIMGATAPSTGGEHLKELERAGIIELVERGLPSPTKRKSTIYRYTGPQ